LKRKGRIKPKEHFTYINFLGGEELCVQEEVILGTLHFSVLYNIPQNVQQISLLAMNGQQFL